MRGIKPSRGGRRARLRVTGVLCAVAITDASSAVADAKLSLTHLRDVAVVVRSVPYCHVLIALRIPRAAFAHA